MNGVEGAPASGARTAQSDGGPGPAEAELGNVIHVTQLERMAERANAALRDALPADAEARAELYEVIAEILSLQGQIMEWVNLHHLLHEVLLALSPFRAALDPSATDDLSPAERQALLQDWRLCQERADLLMDFAEDVKYIGHPFRQAEQELRGERWAVETVTLRLQLEDTLKEDHPSPRALYDLAEDLYTACHQCLALADRHLLAAVGQLERLSRRLLGGVL